MRQFLICLSFPLVGCAPVPPGDSVGGSAEWRDDFGTYSGAVSICFVDEAGLHVTAGERGESLTIGAGGDWTQLEWDASDLSSYYVRSDGGDGNILTPLTECTMHVGTGAGSWIVDVECAEVTASIVVTGCERR